MRRIVFVAIVECVPERIRELAEFAAKRGPIKGIKLIGNYGTPVGKGVTVHLWVRGLQYWKQRAKNLFLPISRQCFLSLEK
ncbi:hypothetical protein DRP07_12505 [Archaeoglobales archaeon]|nr:MAG: hypothetical protein DRP07_12505 [Archaeoglobales archaeon]